MADVIQLQVPTGYDGRVCPCGSAWWDASVTFNQEGSVTGYHSPRCRDCGGPVMSP